MKGHIARFGGSTDTVALLLIMNGCEASAILEDMGEDPNHASKQLTAALLAVESGQEAIRKYNREQP